MNKQDIFDKAVMGVIKQGGPSMDHYGLPLYRGDDGLKCAIGHLIPDDAYCVGMEGKTVAELRREFSVLQHAPLRMLEKLQGAHDGATEADDFMETFKASAASIAVGMRLTIPWAA